MLNLSSLTAFTGNRARRGRPQRRAGLEVLGAFNASSQMALLFPPGVDEWSAASSAGDQRLAATPRPGAAALSVRAIRGGARGAGGDRLRPFDVHAHTGADIDGGRAPARSTSATWTRSTGAR